MSETIYTASDLKDRRVEILDQALTGRAVVRAVDGTALVVIRLRVLEHAQVVARWSMALHAVSRGQTPTELHWLRHLDSDDQAAFRNEALDALADVAAGGPLDPLEQIIAEWRTTALALADPARRSVLLGAASEADFERVDRPALAE